MSAAPRFRIYGQILESSFPFRNRLAPAPKPDLSRSSNRVAPLRFALVGPDEPREEGVELLYESPYRGHGDSLCRLYRTAGGERMTFPGLAEHDLGEGSIRARPLRPGVEAHLEVQLLGAVLAYLLERRGVLALHASGIDLGGRAIGLLAGHGNGKTSLAWSLMAAGHSLLSDDLLAVEERGAAFAAHPGHPQMRLWPEQAARFVGGLGALPRVVPDHEKRILAIGGRGPGRFQADALPLAALYLLERGGEDASIEITGLPPRDALAALLRHSFTPFVVEAVGLHAARLDRLARLLAAVPLRRLRYPSGLERLPEVAAALTADAE